MSVQKIISRQIESPLGPLFAAVTIADTPALCILEYPGPRGPRALDELQRLFDCPIEPDAPDPTAVLDNTEQQLSLYFAGDLTKFDLPLLTPGTDFQRAVWDQLVKIPFGQTISYGELAERVGRPGAQRAAGAANGKNRLSIIIPCHRVIDANGNLHGYGGGLDRKRALLELEGAIAPEPGLFV